MTASVPGLVERVRDALLAGTLSPDDATALYELLESIVAAPEAAAALRARPTGDAVGAEREACAQIAERDVDWATFYCEGVASDLGLTDMTPTDRGILTYRAGIQAGRMIAVAIRSRSQTDNGGERG